MANPALFLATLNGNLAYRDRSGTGTLTGTGAVRYQPAEGARVNWIKNPRFANGTWNSTWGSSGAVSAATEETTIVPAPGEVSAKIVNGAGIGYWTTRAPLSTADARGRNFSCYAYTDGSAVSSSHCRLIVNNNQPSTTYENMGGGWYRLSTNNSGATTNNVSGVRVESGVTVYLTRFMFDDSDGGAVTDYFDGSTGGVWLDPITGILGTAHASPSVERAVAWVEEGTTNLVTNPSYEAGTGGVTGWGSSSRAVATTHSYIGSQSLKVDVTGVGGGMLHPTLSGLASVAETFTASAWVWMASGVTVQASGYARYTDATEEVLGTPVNLAGDGSWQRIVVTYSPNPAKTADNVRIRLTANPGQTFYVDAVQIEKKAYATSYCDGSLGTGYAWTGTAHASTSTRTATQISVNIDADVSTSSGAVALVAKRGDETTDTSNDQRIIDIGDTGAGENLVLFTAQYGSQVLQWVHYNAASAIGDDSLSSVDWTDWQKVINQWNGTAITGGLLSAATLESATLSTPHDQDTFASDKSVTLGHDRLGLNQINGYIGPVMIFDRPLTAGERAALLAAFDVGSSSGKLWSLIGGNRYNIFQLRPIGA